MARAALSLIFLAACGLASKDVDVSADFQAGGGPPTAGTSIDSTKLLAPISSDVRELNSVTLKAARLEATDGGNLQFVCGAQLKVSGNGLADAVIASTQIEGSGAFAVTSTELKPYLQAGGLIAATVTYCTPPVTARGLRLTLTLHASLL